MSRIDDLFSDLRMRGSRMTKARMAIIRLFVQYRQPLSADDVRARIEKSHPDVNKTTIYRELAFLETTGVVMKVEFGDQVRRYELKGDDHHHHAVCTKCGRVEDVDADEDLLKQERKLTRRSGFKILSHSLEFFGLCPTCQ